MTRRVQPVHVVTVVWGEAFIRTYLALCLPNQMSPGNLPALANGAQTTYKVYTNSVGAAAIRSAPAFGDLAALVPTEVIAFDHILGDDSHADNALLKMTAAHRAAVDDANAAGAAIVFLPPDQIYCDGAFARCLELAGRGVRAVVTTGVRTLKEQFEPLVAAPERRGRPWASRELIALALPHLSPIAQSLFVDAEPFSDGPVHVYFRVDETGFVARSLHLHPLWLAPRRRVPLRYGNFDTDFLRDACPDPRDYHVVDDSDEIVAVEVSPESKQLGQAGRGTFDTRALAEFYRLHGNRLHRRFLRTPIRIHTGDLTRRWDAVARESAEVVRRALPVWHRLGRW